MADRLRAIQAGLSGGHVTALDQLKPARRGWLWLAAATAVLALLGATFAKSRSTRVPVVSSRSAQAPRQLSPPFVPSSTAQSEPPTTPTTPTTVAPALPAGRAKVARAKPIEAPLTLTTASSSTALPHTVSDFGGRR